MNWLQFLITTLGFVLFIDCVVIVDFTELQEARSVYYGTKFRLYRLQGRDGSPLKMLVDSQAKLKSTPQSRLPYYLRKTADKLQGSIDSFLREYRILTAPPLSSVKTIPELRHDINTLQMKVLMKKGDLLRSYPNILENDPFQISLKKIEENCFALEKVLGIRPVVNSIKTAVRKLYQEDKKDSRKILTTLHGFHEKTKLPQGSFRSKNGFLSDAEKYHILKEQLTSVKRALEDLRTKRISTLKDFGIDPTSVRLDDALVNLKKLRHWLQHQAWMSTRPSPIPHAIMIEAVNLHNSMMKRFRNPEVVEKIKAYHEKLKNLSPSQLDQVKDIEDNIHLHEYLVTSLRQRMRQIYHHIIGDDQVQVETPILRARILQEKLDALATLSVSSTKAQNAYNASSFVGNLKDFLQAEGNVNEDSIMDRKMSYTSQRTSRLSSEIAVLKKFLLLNAPNPASVKSIVDAQNMSNQLQRCIHILNQMDEKSADPLFLEARTQIIKVNSDFTQRFPPPANAASPNTAKDFDTGMRIYRDKIADLHFLLEHSITQTTLLVLIAKAIASMEKLIASESSPTNRLSELQLLNNLKTVQTFLQR